LKTIFISIAFATAAVALAQAQTTTSTQKCEDTVTGGRVCTTETSKEPLAPGLPAPMTQKEQSAEDARIAKWEAYCKPTIKQGSDGIDRYQYADPGCASGKSER
jgi:hypothetical protein